VSLAVQGEKQMEKVLDSIEVSSNFDKILSEVKANGDNIVVEQAGQAVAVVVSIKVYEQWKKTESEAFLNKMREVQEIINLSPEEADVWAAEMVQEYRQSLK
jgi:prevent-host-death family protein